MENKILGEEKKLLKEEEKILGEEKRILKEERKILGMERNYFIAAAVIIVAILLILVFVVLNSNGTNQIPSFDNLLVPTSLIDKLRISNSISSAVGIGYAINIPNKTSAAPLTEGGKPVIFYAGADYCPFCAFERWSLVIALLRFGNFTNLRYMTSSAADSPPSLPSFTFYNTSYTSNYIIFEGIESSTNSNPPLPLQSLTQQQLAILQRFDPNGYIPFIDFANRTVLVGATYADLTVLANKNWSVIANKLQNASSVQAGSIIGSANLITAEICLADGNQPQSVCGAGYITAIEKAIS